MPYAFEQVTYPDLSGFVFTEPDTVEEAKLVGRVARHKTYRQKWYARNKGSERDRMRERARVTKARLVEEAGGKCMDCGGAFPVECFDFDHRDPFTKGGNVSRLCVSSYDAAKAEADKCDLVCANCHRIRTARSQSVSKKMKMSTRSAHLQ